MKQRVVWCLAISVLACTPAYLGAECIVITKKPERVSGAFCGRLFTRNEPEPVPDTLLTLADSNGTVVANARSDAKGDFTFPPLGRGVYSVQVEGLWVIMPGQGDIQIASPGAEKCTRPLTVYVGLSYPDCQGGWVSPKRPPKGKQEGEK